MRSELLAVALSERQISYLYYGCADDSRARVWIQIRQTTVQLMSEPLNFSLNRVSFQLVEQYHDPSCALERLKKFGVLVCLRTRECTIIGFESGFWLVELGE